MQVLSTAPPLPSGRVRVPRHAAMQRSHRDGKLAPAEARQTRYKGLTQHRGQSFPALLIKVLRLKSSDYIDISDSHYVI